MENYNYKQFEIILQLTVDILNQLNLRYYLDGGTLLGAVRDKYFINGDDDIDLGVFDSELTEEKLEALCNILKENGFYIRRKQPNVLTLVHNTNVQIELWRVKYNAEEKYYWHKGWSGKFIFPAYLLNTLSTINYLNAEYSAPSNPLSYIENLYGKDWLQPQSMKKPYDFTCYTNKDWTHKDFLFYLLNILEENNIPYTFICGTLLGAIRDKNFLPGDDKDTDIAVDSSYYWTVREILNKLMIHSHFYYKYIWRKEIAICSNVCKYKLDIFFLEKQEDKYLLYSYKPNPIDRKWNQEWRIKLNYDNFYPLKSIKFLGRLVSVPNNYEKVLEELYGSGWTKPDENYYVGKYQDIDKNYNEFYPAGIIGNEYPIEVKQHEIGYIVINFLRKKETQNCILSLKRTAPNVKIYLADQDEPCGEMISFYEKNNVEYYYVPKDIGLSWCRNFLIEKVKEPYLMWGDNDFIFTENHNMNHALTILQSNSEVGFVGGAVIRSGIVGHYERILSYIPKYKILIYIPLEVTEPEPNYVNNIEYYYCDLTYNYVICKTEILKTNKLLRWNEKLKCAMEHTDAFLRIQKYSDYKVVYCPSMTVIHGHVSGNAEYNSYRLRKDARPIFADDWGLKMNFMIGRGKENYYTGQIVKSKDLQIKKSVNVPDPPTLPELDVALEKNIKSPDTNNLIQDRKIVLYSATAMKGILWAIYESLKKLKIDVTCIQKSYAYSNGDSYPYQYLFNEHKEQCLKAIEQADTVIFVQYYDKEIHNLAKNKKKIGLFVGDFPAADTDKLKKFCSELFTTRPEIYKWAIPIENIQDVL